MRGNANPGVCPFCGGSNACTADSGACWCFTLQVPKAMLVLVPAALRNRVCVCQTCIRAFQADPQGFTERCSPR